MPAEEQKMIEEHHKAFLDDMSDDLKTTDVLDGFMNLLKAINSNLTDLKVSCYRFLSFQVPWFKSFEILSHTMNSFNLYTFSTIRNCSKSWNS